jgi:hypothetical protein
MLNRNLVSTAANENKLQENPPQVSAEPSMDEKFMREFERRIMEGRADPNADVTRGR